MFCLYCTNVTILFVILYSSSMESTYDRLCIHWRKLNKANTMYYHFEKKKIIAFYFPKPSNTTSPHGYNRQQLETYMSSVHTGLITLNFFKHYHLHSFSHLIKQAHQFASPNAKGPTLMGTNYISYISSYGEEKADETIPFNTGHYLEWKVPKDLSSLQKGPFSKPVYILAKKARHVFL